MLPLPTSGEVWQRQGTRSSGGYHGLVTSAWIRSFCQPNRVGSTSVNMVAPEEQLPLWCFLWKGGCTTDKARRVREGMAARTCSQLEMSTLSFPTLAVVWAADCSFSGSSLRFVLALWVNHVRRSHFNSHAFRSNYTFKWLNKSGRKHIYCRTKAVNIDILFYISITSRL